MGNALGTDTSTYNPVNPATLEAHTDFVLARAAIGATGVDGSFAKVWPKLYGPRGLYGIVTTTGGAGGDNLVNVGQRYGLNDDDIIVSDFEALSDGSRPTVDHAIAYMGRIVARRPHNPKLLYTANWYLNGFSRSEVERLTKWCRDHGVGLHLADYDGNPGTAPSLPAGATGWKMKQYTSSGSVPGVSGHVDRDAFNGALQAMLDWMGSQADTGGGSGGGSTTSDPTMDAIASGARSRFDELVGGNDDPADPHKAGAGATQAVGGDNEKLGRRLGEAIYTVLRYGVPAK
jgi:hypothetical protein